MALFLRMDSDDEEEEYSLSTINSGPNRLMNGCYYPSNYTILHYKTTLTASANLPHILHLPFTASASAYLASLSHTGWSAKVP